MADKIFEDDTLISKRFTCACLYPTHIIDISVELADEERRLVACTLDFYAGAGPFKWRLKQAWNLLRGKEGFIDEFEIRPEDISEMIEILERAKPVDGGTSKK